MVLKFLQKKEFSAEKDNYNTKGREFFGECQEIVNSPDFILYRVINMDETSIYLDFPMNVTFAPKGVKRVSAVTTGSERTRLSAAFSASASGHKLPILVLVPRKNDLPNFTSPSNVIVLYKTGATFNENIICEYLEKVVAVNNSRWGLTNTTLILDSARCHLTKQVEEKMKEIKVNKLVIPPLLTNLYNRQMFTGLLL